MIIAGHVPAPKTDTMMVVFLSSIVYPHESPPDQPEGPETVEDGMHEGRGGIS